MRRTFAFTLSAILSLSIAGFSGAEEYLNGITWDTPPIVTPGETDNAPPADAVVLFDGTDYSNWNGAETWTIEDGAAIVGKGFIVSKDEFGDCQLHVEWSAPLPAEGTGQGRGNSGIFMMGKYELQVLDSYENETYHDGQAGAIYKQTPPAANVNRKPGEWNTYDIAWTAPRFNEDGSLKSPAYMTVFLNGVLIHNHFELKGDTPFNRPPEYKAHGEKGPISIQDHKNPVRFRNIWVREFKQAAGEQTAEPYLR
ncbi:hypothetical protein Poly51_02680 [Rubripirellula tenax]|uniref:3-keto-alpha-glucoside-1,2-lyase/3-keto-2-hydroxy-glucal hydratase domain-containing protein n=1 Tax=Rubripirellula tenax TaxID=2528015 RepID=A0A5C6FGL5_9BACT|nr:DUF1080 domain-containing protein [Rubripirellula tenax]TWU59995.1 hypothetical protein Poly51_02680 [Rubripirellula tenax]